MINSKILLKVYAFIVNYWTNQLLSGIILPLTSRTNCLFMDSTKQLLTELAKAYGSPGYKTPVREVFTRFLSPIGELSQDKINNVI